MRKLGSRKYRTEKPDLPVTIRLKGNHLSKAIATGRVRIEDSAGEVTRRPLPILSSSDPLILTGKLDEPLPGTCDIRVELALSYATKVGNTTPFYEVRVKSNTDDQDDWETKAKRPEIVFRYTKT